MKTTKLIWHPEKRKIKDLKNWTANPRKITEEAFKKLKERIRQRGFHDIIKIDLDDTVLSGNQRKRALIELEIKEVICLVPNRKLTKDERDKVALESNTNDGSWDFEALKSFNFDLLLDIGFDKEDLAFWDKDLEVEGDRFDVEEELEKIKVPKTKLGDLIILGQHKVICGDSGDPNIIKKLFGNEKASLVYSDPPYNIRLNYSKGLGGKRSYGGSVKDNRTDKEYEEFLRKSMQAATTVTEENSHWFYWSSQLYIWLIQVLFRELGIENKSVCLWAKNSQNPVPSLAFNRAYEPAIYGTRGKPYLAKDIRNLNEFLNKEVGTGNSSFEDLRDIWTVKRMSGKDMEHATSKPPQLHQKAILRCTRPGDIILDSFSGSASTLVAGEQLKRRVYAVELEPVFCDLAIRRWEKLTGGKAKIIKN